MNRSLSIEVPASGSYLRLVRMLVTAFAAEAAGVDVEEAARVRLAVSEACVAVLEALPSRPHTDAVHVGARVEPDCIDLEVRTAAPSPVAERDLAVVRALADDVEVRTDGADQVVRVRLRLGVGGRAGVDV